MLSERPTTRLQSTRQYTSPQTFAKQPKRVRRLHAPYQQYGCLDPLTDAEHSQGPMCRAASLTAQIEREKSLNQELLKQMLNYRYEVDTTEGQLVISVMREEWITRCTDLLAETFVDTKGIQAYRRFVRKNIHTYVEQHHKMPPSSVVLVAVMHTPVTADTSADGWMLDNSTTEANTGSSSSRAGNHANSSSSSDSRAGNHANSSSSSDSSAGNHANSSSSSGNGVESHAVQQLASGPGAQQQQQQHGAVPREVQQLVGVAEVSFREFTRSSYLTLNPPQHCAYLCNMAVAADWRRQGIAMQLITAVEDMCSLAGESDVFLHLRCKDSEVAGGLYNKAGFSTFKKDWPIVVLIGQEPRFLMRKQLQPDRALVGRVQLPQKQKEGEQCEQPQEQQDKVVQPAAASSAA